MNRGKYIPQRIYTHTHTHTHFQDKKPITPQMVLAQSLSHTLPADMKIPIILSLYVPVPVIIVVCLPKTSNCPNHGWNPL